MPDEAVAESEHERETECPKEQCAQTRVDDALLQDVDDLAGAGEAGLEHHESGLHEEHQECREQNPCRVLSVDHVLDRNLGVRGSCVDRLAEDQLTRPEDRCEGNDDPDQLSTEKGHEEPLPVLVS